MSTHTTPEEIPMQDGEGHDLAIRVRGLVNRFGSQTVHEDLDLDVRRGGSWAWSVARAPASRC